jgi:hypothetical protein
MKQPMLTAIQHRVAVRVVIPALALGVTLGIVLAPVSSRAALPDFPSPTGAPCKFNGKTYPNGFMKNIYVGSDSYSGWQTYECVDGEWLRVARTVSPPSSPVPMPYPLTAAR